MNLIGELSLPDIIQVEFPNDQYIREPQQKKQICLHFTAGYDNAQGVFDWWSRSKERVATCVAIRDDGRIYQGFNSRYWAWHINVRASGNVLPEHFSHYKDPVHAENLEKNSIGIEICNWGPLTIKEDGLFHTYISTPNKPVTVDESRVLEFPNEFRGYRYYEKFTDAELEQTWRLLKYWCKEYDIPAYYHPEMWDVYGVALSGQPGIYTHLSYRNDKHDCPPQPELIEMLKAL